MNILPKIEVPQYSTKIPSSNKTITYRPYLVKEEKVLLIALESEDYEQISNAINNIVLECTNNTISLDELTIFDIEYLFVKIRAKAVGETIDLTYKCQAEECEKTKEIKVNFDDVKVVGLEETNMRHDLGNGLIIDLKYPSVSSKDALKDVDDEDIIIYSVANLIDTIYHGDESYSSKDISIDEIVEFLGNMNTTQFNPLLGSIVTMPHIEYNIEWKCTCGHDNKISYASLADFFI